MWQRIGSGCSGCDSGCGSGLVADVADGFSKVGATASPRRVRLLAEIYLLGCFAPDNLGYRALIVLAPNFIIETQEGRGDRRF